MERLQQIRVDRPRADVAVFELVGEYDMSNSLELDAALEEAVMEGRGIVLDLTQTQFLDSSTIHVFFSAHEALAKRAGRRLALHVQTASVVMRALEICSVVDRIPIAAERERAVAIATGSEPGKA